MPISNLLRRLFARLVSRLRFVAQTASFSTKQWRRQLLLDALEAERLDRLRHPSKYLGKP